MHGPKLMLEGVLRKVYLVPIMDDVSRVLTHSAFCFGETALDIEAVLKQAILKRGLPVKLVVDNGAAYRAKRLQGIRIRLGSTVIFTPHCYLSLKVQMPKLFEMSDCRGQVEGAARHCVKQ